IICFSWIFMQLYISCIYVSYYVNVFCYAWFNIYKDSFIYTWYLTYNITIYQDLYLYTMTYIFIYL
ncbi:hypothetical protein LOTGIDRAFT_59281, partial [Lottia gigantea]